ncbi:hypothetical protein EVA_02253, partial [gut metagenome]
MLFIAISDYFFLTSETLIAELLQSAFNVFKNFCLSIDD